MAYEKNLAGASEGGLEIERPLYCHDIPIFEIAKDLIDDVRGVDAAFLPSWYRQAWWKYAQFFMSPTSSVTPLHFDTLLTHNMFFQVYGKKEFIIMPHSASNYCYRHKWRWFQVDPTKPDLQSFPEYQKAHVQKVILEAGDVLYMPPGTLHHVTTIDASISFNVDFHTPKSALKSFSGLLRGMPKENAYYNFILFLGLIFKVPSNRLFPYYRSYLNYIS